MKSYIKIRAIFFTGLISFVVAGNLLAQEADLAELTQKAREVGISESAITELQSRSQARGMSSQQIAEIVKSAISMSEDNLPSDAAIQKALEGLSKGVPGNRIVSVVDQVHQSLGQAAKIVDPWMNRPEVGRMMGQRGQGMSEQKFRNELAKAASKSIMQNIPSQDVNEVLMQIGDESVLASTGPSEIIAGMGILPDLPEAGNRPQEAGTFVIRALKGGFKAEDLQKLPSAIKMAQQRSELPAASVIEGVGKQMSGGTPAKQILQNLFNGNVGGGPPGNVPPGLKNKKGQGNAKAGQNNL